MAMICPEHMREAGAASLAITSKVDPSRQIVFDEPVLQVEEIQGNILTGFMKSHRLLLFLKADTAKITGFKKWLESQIPFVATAAEVIAFSRVFKSTRIRRGREGTVKSTWMNIAFSFEFLKHLNNEADQFKDLAFRQGLEKRSSELGDPTKGKFSPPNWLVGGPKNRADVMIIIEADDRCDMLEEFSRIQDSIDSMVDQKGVRVDTGITVVFKDEGNNLPAPLSGHEHFGFLDGVSQPGLRGLLSDDKTDVLTLRQTQDARDLAVTLAGPIKTAQGKPGQDVLYPGEFVFGYPLQTRDPDPKFDGPNATPGPDSLFARPNPDPGEPGPAGGKVGPDWAKNGSFLVFRRLRQDVGKFHRFLRDTAENLEIQNADSASGARLVGAKLVGRWPSGAPVERIPNDEDPILGDDDCKNNNFEFGGAKGALAGPNPSDLLACKDDGKPASVKDDQGALCPFSGHIRKAYPRDDEGLNGKKPVPDPHLNESRTQTHRLLRRGLPYGPVSPSTIDTPFEDDIDRGLQFLAYQTSIENQFEFITRNWVNAENFKEPVQTTASDKPIDQGGGHDPIIGQSNAADRARNFTVTFPDPKNPTSTIAKRVTTTEEWVVPTGGGYFFSPSLGALKDHLIK
jgi:Dyp-type peroxidase family